MVVEDGRRKRKEMGVGRRGSGEEKVLVSMEFSDERGKMFLDCLKRENKERRRKPSQREIK